MAHTKSPYGPQDAKARAETAAAEQHDNTPLNRKELLSGARHVTSEPEPPDIMTSDETSTYLWERYRLQRSARRLGQLRAGPADAGPRFYRAGNIALYKRPDVDAWAATQLGQSFASTTDEQAYYAQQRKQTAP
jgi:hypothetical protein